MRGVVQEIHALKCACALCDQQAEDGEDEKEKEQTNNNKTIEKKH